MIKGITVWVVLSGTSYNYTDLIGVFLREQDTIKYKDSYVVIPVTLE